MNAAVKRLPPAEADIIRAAEWYDDQQPGLGADFAREVDAIISCLATTALLHSIRFAAVRRAPLKRFKQSSVFYFLDGEGVIVFAVFHGARHPQWLRHRRTQIL